MDKLSDNYLMLKVQEGQLNFASLLFERYKKRLYAYFYNQTRDCMFSEDLVQQAFYRLIKYRARYKAGDHFKSWIFTIARNAMIDEIRKNKRHKASDVSLYQDQFVATETADHDLELQEKRAMLDQALSKISEEKREILTLVKLHEKKYKEVAEILGINEGSIRSKVFRALKELQQHYCHMKETSTNG